MKAQIKVHSDLLELVKIGQSGAYKGFVRSYAGKIQNLVKLKNPLDAHIMVHDIEMILDIIDPNLEKDITWFKELEKAVKLWSNEIVIANRLLGIKDDNVYDVTEFEKAIMQHFFMSAKPKHTAIIETDFKTLVDLVELGARRFSK